MSKEKNPGKATESSNTSEQREMLDFQIMLNYSKFLMYTEEQLQKWNEETNCTHWEAGSKHTSKGIPALFNIIPPELLAGSHFPLKQQILYNKSHNN